MNCSLMPPAVDGPAAGQTRRASNFPAVNGAADGYRKARYTPRSLAGLDPAWHTAGDAPVRSSACPKNFPSGHCRSSCLVDLLLSFCMGIGRSFRSRGPSKLPVSPLGLRTFASMISATRLSPIYAGRMQISGQKTMVCFTRYNSFREADLIAAARKSNTYLTLAHAKALEQVHERPQLWSQVLDNMVKSLLSPEWRNRQTQGT